MDIFYDIDAAPPKPSKESFNHLMDVRPLQFMLAMMTKLLSVHFTRPVHFRRDNVERDLVDYRRRVAAALSKAALHNFKTRLKWSMLRDGRWRAHVVAGLGGAAGVARWRARHETYISRKAAQAAAHDISPLPTDAAGWFRLAPIGRVMRPRAALSGDECVMRRGVRILRARLRRDIWDGMTFEEKNARPYVCRKETLHDIGAPEKWVFEIKPIPVTPDELSRETPLQDLCEDIPPLCPPGQRKGARCRNPGVLFNLPSLNERLAEMQMCGPQVDGTPDRMKQTRIKQEGIKKAPP